MPNHQFVEQNLAIEKSFPPNLKGCQAKKIRKWYFLSQFRIEFGSEWQPWCQVSRVTSHMPHGSDSSCLTLLFLFPIAHNFLFVARIKKNSPLFLLPHVLCHVSRVTWFWFILVHFCFPIAQNLCFVARIFAAICHVSYVTCHVSHGSDSFLFTLWFCFPIA